MGSPNKRTSFYTPSSGLGDDKAKIPELLWSPMLDSVATGKRLPEKNILVLGALDKTRRGQLLILCRREYRVSEGIPGGFIIGRCEEESGEAEQQAASHSQQLRVGLHISRCFGCGSRRYCYPKTVHEIC